MLKPQILFLSILPFFLVACSSGGNSTTTTTTSLLQGQFRLEQSSVPRCAGVRLEAQFNSNTFPKRVQYRLDFGSGEKPITTTEEKPLFKYTSSGKYTIKAEALLDGQVQYQQSLEVNVTSGGACTYVVLFNKEPIYTKQRSQTLEARIARTLRSSGGTRLYTFQQVFQGYAAQLEPNEVDSTAKASDVEAVFLDSVGESSLPDTLS
jgi:hypothetical protein